MVKPKYQGDVNIVVANLESAIASISWETGMAVKSKARHDLTLRGIEREISAGRDVASWLDKAYAHLDSGLFGEADIAGVEELAAACCDGIDRAEEPTEAGAAI